MSRPRQLIIEILGEGPTEVAGVTGPERPTRGVLPILVYKICQRPAEMWVRCRRISFLLQKGGLQRKLRFAVRQARISGSAGLVFVVDSDGDYEGKLKQLSAGRDAVKELAYPVAIGVAHPCIEAWLLADSQAIARAFGLARPPHVPENPETLPAPSHDKSRNPKSELRQSVGAKRLLSAEEKARIAAAIDDVSVIERHCPRSFVPFANEVRSHICPLFSKNCDQR